MIWEKGKLLKKSIVGNDKLNNPIYSLNCVKEIDFRFVPWSKDDVNLESREVILNQTRIAIPIQFKKLPKFDYIEIDGIIYSIKKVVDVLPRYTSLSIQRYTEDV